MRPVQRSWKLAQTAVLWLSTRLLVTAPLWWILGIGGLVLGLCGPLGILGFKPGENLAGKLVLAALLASPTLLGLALLARRGSSLRPGGRAICVVGLSLLWHVPGTIVWSLIVRGLN